MSEGLTVRLSAPYDQVVPRVREALAGQGFGVLTEIDVSATMQAKLGAAVEPYLILGACNPPLAYAALEVDRRIGVLLPCNVVVRSDPDRPDTTIVEAVDPQDMVAMTGRPQLQPVADDAAARLSLALGTLVDG
ncbi:MAG: DUF302 domain-containing protein [Actinomycetes bacterium]